MRTSGSAWRRPQGAPYRGHRSCAPFRRDRSCYGRKRRNDVLDNGRDIGDNILERFHHVIDELLHIGVGSAEARYEVLDLFGLLLIKIIGGLRSSEMDYIFAHCDKFYTLPPAKDQAESEA